MKRIALAAVAVLALGASTVPASAQECPEGTALELHLDLDLNGDQQSQDVCLPPSGGEEPALPGLPELPFP